jgi:hypothetical protein
LPINGLLIVNELLEGSDLSDLLVDQDLLVAIAIDGKTYFTNYKENIDMVSNKSLFCTRGQRFLLLLFVICFLSCVSPFSAPSSGPDFIKRRDPFTPAGRATIA